ncbi:fumarylacetoacetate hydrolase family protein [Jiangella asiatica]|uniref:fumarylacetoacetate hydrolase family protein n=1 Tax=Jiangella asiatica TaxID=2530372 RepID=UPI0013A5D8CB|nr:fumarylacetoacetate hydrolase family protein [Jiangella asiatica]
MCVGLNYATHIAETGRPTPRHPPLLAKYDGALISEQNPVVLPTVSEAVDWEAELGVVIGAATPHLPVGSALDVVAGYTVVNDVTGAQLAAPHPRVPVRQDVRGHDARCPTLVTPDELPAGASSLDISCTVDGVVMRHSTPAGSVPAAHPKSGLRPGNELVTTIDGIGRLHTRCVKERREAVTWPREQCADGDPGRRPAASFRPTPRKRELSTMNSEE